MTYNTQHNNLLHRAAIAASNFEKSFCYLAKTRELNRLHKLSKYVTPCLRYRLKFRQCLACTLGSSLLEALEAAHADPARRFLIFLDEFNRCREMARSQTPGLARNSSGGIRVKGPAW